MIASERAAFVRAIRRCPRDNTARLVYADWLQENGEPERAEFIRAQIAGRQTPHLDGYVRAWERAIEGIVGTQPCEHRPTVRFDRGFVAVLAVPITDFVPHAARLLELFADEPLRRIELPGTAPYESSGMFTWRNGGRWTTAFDWDGPDLPTRLFNLLTGGCFTLGVRYLRRYGSLAAAQYALSNACRALARS